MDLGGLIRGLQINTSLTSLHVVTKWNDAPQQQQQQQPRQPLGEHIFQVLHPVLEHDNFTLLDLQCTVWEADHSSCRALGLPPSLAFYTQLNQRGRHRLLRGNDGESECDAESSKGPKPLTTTHRDKVAAVVQAATASTPEGSSSSCSSNNRRHRGSNSDKEDLSTLYYWLRMQPALLCH